MKFYFYNKWKELKQFAKLNNNQNLIYIDLQYNQKMIQMMIHSVQYQVIVIHQVIVNLLVIVMIQNGIHTLMIYLKMIIQNIIQVKD